MGFRFDAMASSTMLAQGFSLKNVTRKGTFLAREPAVLRGPTSARAKQSRSSRGLHVRAQVGTQKAYQKLQGLNILRGTDGEPVDITTTWGPTDKAVVVWLRSFG